MKRVLMIVAALVVAPALVLAGYGSSSSNNAQAGLDKLKSLAGEWQTTGGPEGADAKTRITYRVVSNGSAVMETIDTPGEADMITMYHVDGDRIMMTHYCAMGNQPRMRATVPSGDVKELVFKFVDGANMKKNDKHMHNLTMTFVDDSHVKAVWGLYDKGKLAQDVEFTYTRAAQ